MSSYAPPSNQQMGKNPMLPDHPVTSAMDAQYAAEEAQLRQQISQQYADILQQLGYLDENGDFIPGSVSTNAMRQQADLERGNQIAGENVTKEHQQQGTLFSGLRGTDQARAEYPFQQQMIQLGIDTPMQLSQLHEQAAGLVDQYTLQNNLLLSSAAQRAAAAQQNQPTGDLGGDTPGDGGDGGDSGWGWDPYSGGGGDTGGGDGSDGGEPRQMTPHTNTPLAPTGHPGGYGAAPASLGKGIAGAVAAQGLGAWPGISGGIAGAAKAQQSGAWNSLGQGIAGAAGHAGAVKPITPEHPVVQIHKASMQALKNMRFG